MAHYYYECPNCGGNLDPGEICDCRNAEKEVQKDVDNDRARRIEVDVGKVSIGQYIHAGI